MRFVTLKSLSAASLLVTLSCTIALAQSVSNQDFIKRGNARYANAEYDSAIAEYRHVSPAAGDVYARALYNIGVCYYELGRTEAAIAMYRQAIKVRSDYVKALYALGVALEDLGRYQEAGETYRAAIAVSGGRYALASFKLGVLAAGAGEYEVAETLFRESISQSGDRLPTSHNNLGVMLALAGNLNEAEREFRIALKQTDGTSADAKRNLSLCRSLMNATAKAEVGSLQLAGKPDARIQ